MILKVAALIWNRNAALSRSIRRATPGGVKSRLKFRRFLADRRRLASGTG
jgi:hypothetical protein